MDTEDSPSSFVAKYINDTKINKNEQACFILGIVHSCKDLDELVKIKNILKVSTLTNKDKDKYMNTVDMFIDILNN